MNNNIKLQYKKTIITNKNKIIMKKQSYLTKSRYLLLFLFALIVGSGSAWADNADFENELPSGWGIVGSMTYYERPKTGSYSIGNDKNSGWETNRGNYITTTKLQGDINIWIRSYKSGYTGYVSLYKLSDDGTTVGDQLTYFSSSSTTFAEKTYTLNSATRLAIVINYAHLDNMTYTEFVSGPQFKVKDGSTTLSSPYAYNFGLATAGTTKVFTLSNPGTQATPIAVDVTGANGFTAAVEGNATSIPAGGQKTLTITMPNATASGSIVVTPTGAGLSAFTFNVSGTVRDPNKVYLDFSDGKIPDGWTSVQIGSYGSAWSASTGYISQSGSNSSYAWAFTSPKMNFTNGEKIFFETAKYSSSTWYNPSVTVEYTTDATGATGWTAISSAFTNDTYGNWTKRSVTIPVDGVKRIRFNGWYVHMRNIYGGELPIEPKNLSVSRQGTSATMTWTAANTETAWQVYIDTNENAINGSITPEDVATTPSYTFENLTVGFTYYTWVRSNFGGGSYSDWVRTSFSLTYRAAAPTSVDNDGITNVTFGSGAEIVNYDTSKSPYYQDNSAQIGGATVGQSSNLAITFSTGYGYGTVVWVDWNKNYEFEDSEIVYAGESGSSKPTTLDASFIVPALQATGNYRMRIAAADSYYDSHKTMATAAGADPYPTGTYCVVHDYTLKVNEAADYAMSITGSDVSENTIAFGTVKNTTSTKKFTIKNDGGSALTNVSVVSSDAEVFTVSDTDFDLASSETKDITVTFVKAVEDDYDETITISQANVSDKVLTVTATYQAPTPATMGVTIAAAAVGETVAFGTVNKATTKTFTVANTGEATLNATIALSGTDAAKFTLSTTSLEVAGGESETFDVTFDSDDEDVAKTATVTLSAAGLSDVAFNVTGTYSNFWTEDFSTGTLPTGWTQGTWTISTFSSYENTTSMALAPSGSTAGTIMTPRLAAKAGDVLTWDGYFNWYDEAMTVEWSNDGVTGWTKIYDAYKAQDEVGSTRYTHKAMSFTAPADGNYYLRFTSTYSNGVDNFSGFKLNIPDHIMSITASSIPASGLYSPTMKATKSFNASVTVKENRGVAETGVVAKVYMGSTVIGTSESTDFVANESKVINITATPAVAATEGILMHIEVEYAGGTLSTTPETRYVAELVRLDMTDTAEPTITTGYSAVYDLVTLNRTYAEGWNTIVLPVATELSEFGEDAKAYSFTGNENDVLKFTKVTSGSLNAATPYLLYLPSGLTKTLSWESPVIYSTYVGEENIKTTQNGVVFQGTYAPIAAPGMNGMWGVTAAGKIGKGTSTAFINGFRAYFTGISAGARVVFFGEDETTSIKNLTPTLSEGEGVYNLQGQKVENLKKGQLYIKNGKKVVKK